MSSSPPDRERSGPGPWAVHVTTAGGTEAELAADALWQAGAAAIEERAVPGGVVLVAATGHAHDPRPLLGAVEGRWPAEAVTVDLDAALDAWRPHARPVVAGRFVVRPPWVRRDGAVAGGVGGPDGDGGREVVVDPGRAFGSGAHASTRLALRALDRLVGHGDRVLDVGCGSGVLGIAALVGGAAAAVGIDNDPQALAAARANAARNAVSDRLALAERLPGPGRPLEGRFEGPFDLVVANMLSPTLIELAPAICGRLADGARLVLSGLLVPQRVDVLAAYPDLDPVAADEDDGWLALVLRRGSGRRQPAGSIRATGPSSDST